ncbi:murein L,D-transpeptidase catalytic domain family protein [Legionella maioricensis]|uniref:Murein L,D-transpeptidase catalytic domain family protein n=1 Tax=Legionella maioricensis TaxID=2896528 RepID=A0A9X2D284_9GAMM|nr:murein L,D-transpeptidase catalytic domain family protein [Legionella maioricensis]MCL9684735.1 murein L,D-transpeptidase catalytic domain family protein [Legionella maioricensis]MCL9687763.1 murein L,D-transpeptidase catalytic domain family protein [Legionella maioricensis]
MSHLLLLLLAVTYSGFSLPPFALVQEKIISVANNVVNEIPSITMPLNEISDMLHQQAPQLNELVINKVLTTLRCAMEYNVDRNNILTIIDYSLPSNEKRLWVFDLKEKKLLFYTYVSHGIKSGTLATNYFSNKFNSKASSIGVYKTEQAYYGREGLSLRLDGLDANFNDNASNRSVVMHGGWYVEEQFIKRYGRPGRSWGCPALPLGLYQPIINTIKDKSLLVAYYPSDAWFGKSKFLNCNKIKTTSTAITLPKEPKITDNSEQREDVLFASISKTMKHADDNPIVAMSADNYERIFHAKAPLGRMLRRQINNAEYIALSNAEFHTLAVHSNEKDREGLNAINFIVPVIIMVRGYYETQMKILDMGKIKDIRFNADLSKNETVTSYSVSFERRPSINLKATNRFIRWVGL